MTAPTLTMKQVREVFNVTSVTLYHWRNGTPTKEPLPSTTDDKLRVHFSPSALMKWAKKNKVAIAVDPVKILERGDVAEKPGPKPRIKTEKAVARKSIKAKKEPIAKEAVSANGAANGSNKAPAKKSSSKKSPGKTPRKSLVL